MLASSKNPRSDALLGTLLLRLRANANPSRGSTLSKGTERPWFRPERIADAERTDLPCTQVSRAHQGGD